MIRRYLIVLFLLLNINTITGQEALSKRNTIYYELWGPGHGIVSINYERLKNLNDNCIFTYGIGIAFSNYIKVSESIQLLDNQALFPIQGNFLFGNRKKTLELGLGIPIAISSEKLKLITSIYSFRVGFRYMPFDKDLMIRISLNPTLYLTTIGISAGFSVGYYF